MLFGICIPSANAAAAKAAGWDYVEDNAQGLLQGLVPDDQWVAPPPAALPVVAVNVLVPGSLKITGPAVDLGALRAYMEAVARRAAGLGVRTMVFGSGAARMVPAGFDPVVAGRQVVAFAAMAAPVAAARGIMLVVEPLNRGECNIVNSVAEADRIVAAVDHPNCQALVDTWHLWMEHEPLANVAAAMPRVRHVHVADLDGRVAPGLSGKADYRPFFAVLKAGGYNATISVESAPIPDFETVAPRVLAFLKHQWASA